MKRVWWRQRPRLLTGRLGKMALYGSSRSIVEGLLGVRGMLLAGMLGPQLFGVWALFRLVLNYGAFAGIGLQRGLELEVAKVRAPEHQPVRTAWARTAVGCTFAIFGLVSVLTGASALMVDEAWLEQLLWAIAAGLLLERMWFYGLNYLRASGSLREYAVLELAQAALQVLLTVGLAWLYGLPGAFAGFALASLIMMVLVSRQVPYRPAFDLKRLRVMLAIGVPLSLSMLLSTLAATVDRVIVGALLGVAALGQYAFAVSVANLGVTAAMIVRTVVFPDLYSRLDQDGAAELKSIPPRANDTAFCTPARAACRRRRCCLGANRCLHPATVRSGGADR